jgi:hypothetical protein
MLHLPCTCECHDFCHTCGVAFIKGKPHQNCGDTVSTKGGGPASYSIPLTNEAFTDFEREGYSDHVAPA